MPGIFPKHLVTGLCYLVLGGLPFYYFLRDYSEVSVYLYSAFLLALMIEMFIVDLKNKINNHFQFDRFAILELLIAINALILFLAFNFIDRALVLLFVALYISKNIFFFSSVKDFSNGANMIVLSGVFGCVGIILGFIEVLVGDTHFLSEVMTFDYPYSNGIGNTTLINGFFASANGSAYCIGAGIAFLKYQNLFNLKLKRFLYIIFMAALAVTKTKFAVLLLASFIVLTVLKSRPARNSIAALLALAFSYIFLSHFIIAPSGSYDYPSIHFRKIIFSIQNIDLVLGNYGMYKLYVLDAIESHLLHPFGQSYFQEVYGGRPHFMLGGLIVSGGLGIASLVSLYVFFIFQANGRQFLDGIKDNKIYLIVLFAFMVETVNWNFSNSFYFWSLIFGVTAVNKISEIT